MPLIKETKFDKLTIRIYSDRSAAGCAAAADGAATLGRLLKKKERVNAISPPRRRRTRR